MQTVEENLAPIYVLQNTHSKNLYYDEIHPKKLPGRNRRRMSE